MAGRLLALAVLYAGAAIATPITTVVTSAYNTASVVTSGIEAPSSTAEVTASVAAPSSYGGAAASSYHSPAFLPKGSSLKAALSQYTTNGNSLLGTLKAPKLPNFLTSNPLPNGKPWGTKTAYNTNPYTTTPNTGVTRYYNFNVSRQSIAPDGFTKDGMVINGAFPGPTIEANWGDWIEIVVTNNLGDEGTSMHWHGLLQTVTPWMDGVPSVQQCPIAPGSSFTYRFKADLYGTSWYHSHYSAQYAAGLAGAMVIYGPDTASYDVDLGPVMLSDWYHPDYYTLVEQTMAPTSEDLGAVLSNNNLINGKNNYPCVSGTACVANAGISKFSWTTGTTYRLRLINSGAEGIQKFSIDGYELTVIANDFVPITPYTTNVVTLGVGQRSDVIVKASGNATDAVWMRSTLGLSAAVGGCTLNDGVSPQAVAAIYYQSANTSAVPTTTSTVTAAVIAECVNDDLGKTVPAYVIAPPAKPATQQYMNVTHQSNGTHELFYMNNSTFKGDYNDPVLLEAKLGNTGNFSAESNVYNFGSSTSIRLIVYNFAFTGAHPMHMHGHNMYVLAVGQGTWDGTVTYASNPQRRDVQLLPVALSSTEPGYMVVQFDADNPGVWPFHCHIAWHVSAGLYVNLLERPADIKELDIPSTMAQTCRTWSAWTGDNIPNEIDSGL